MHRWIVMVLAAAGACGGDSDAGTPPLPEEWEQPACAWEDQAGGDGGDQAVALAFASDGGLVAGGLVDDPVTRARAYWLRRYSKTGEVTWTREGGLSVYAGEISAVALDPGDRVGVTGWIEEDNYRNDFWVAAFEAGGEPAWSLDLDNGGRGADACFTPTGELYATGSADDPEYRSGSLIWVGKFSAGGELLWSDTDYGTNQGWQNGGDAIVCDQAGGATVLAHIVVPGGPESTGPDTHTWIRRYHADGAVSWTTILGEEFESYGPGAMIADPAGDGLLVTAGASLSRIDAADGAITEELPLPPGAMLAADVDGTYIEGDFSRKADPDCVVDDDDECERIYYWGYAHVDWQGQPIWWRADSTGVPEEVSGAVHDAELGEDGALAVAGSRRGDIWVCYQ